MTATHATHFVQGLSFSPEQLQRRRESIGASDMPAIAGVHHKRTPLDVFLEKTGVVTPFEGNAFTEWGLRLEGAIRQKYVDVTGASLAEHPSEAVETALDCFSCTPDGIVIGIDDTRIPAHGLEIKRFGEYRADDFGVPGTDQVPLDVAVQCHASMIVTQLQRWDVAVLLGQADFRIYTLRFDDEIAGHLYELGQKFWNEHVVPRIAPPIDGSASTARYLQQKYATHSVALLDPKPEHMQIARELAGVKAEIKALEREKATLEHQLQSEIGEAAGIRNVATWKLDRWGRPMWKAIAEELGATNPEHEALIARHTSAPTRRFRLLVEEE